MSIKVSNFKLGLFIFTGTTLLTVLVVMFGAGVFEGKGKTIETYIDGSVQGLDVGSPLKYRGVTIGRVTEITLVDHYYEVKNPAFSRYVLIRMELDPKLERGSANIDSDRLLHEWIKQGMRLKLASQGITGIGYMEADFVREGSEEIPEIPWKPKVTYIPSTRSQLARVADSIESISRDLENAKIPQIAENVDKLLVTVDSAVNDANVKQLSADLRGSLARMQEAVAQVQELASDPKVKQLGPKTVDTIDEVNKTVTQLRTEVTEISEELNKTLKDTQGAVSDVREYLDAPGLNDAASRIGEITRRLDSTLTRVENAFAQKDEQINLILNDMRVMSSNMRDMTELLSQYPSLAAFGQPPAPSEAYEND